MHLRQLEMVLTIAQTGSFTAAGRRLRVSQSAVSRQILLLEEELGTPLFLRVDRRVRLTASGDAIAQLAQRVFADVRDTVTAIGDNQRELTGTLHVAGGMTVCLYVFPQLLKAYRRRHPKVDVKIVSASAPRLLRHVRSGQVDVALMTLPVDAPDLTTVPAMREELLLVTDPAHPFTKSRRITPKQLAGQRFVVFESGSNTRRIVDRFFAEHQIAPEIVMESENVEILKALVRAGIGIAMMPYQAAARDVLSGQLWSSRVGNVRLARQTGWVYPRTSRLPRMMEELFDAFRRVLPRLRLAPPQRRL